MSCWRTSSSSRSRLKPFTNTVVGVAVAAVLLLRTCRAQQHAFQRCTEWASNVLLGQYSKAISAGCSKCSRATGTAAKALQAGATSVVLGALRAVDALLGGVDEQLAAVKLHAAHANGCRSALHTLELHVREALGASSLVVGA